MDKKKETIKAYNDLLFSVYQENELICLPDAQFTYKGKNVLCACSAAVVAMVEARVNTRLDEVTDLLKLPRFNLMHAKNEILSVSADIKYRLGSLYLYLPYMAKLHQSHYSFNGQTQYFHEPTRFDARFNGEVPIAFEALYKFWQG